MSKSTPPGSPPTSKSTPTDPPPKPKKMSSEELKRKIMDELTKGELMDALQISRAIFGKGGRRALVNPTLYRLFSQNEVSKYPPIKGMKPRWGLPKEEVEVKD